MVVDDEERDRRAMSRILRKEGYAVLEAVSYSDAMARFDLNREAVKLLVADVSLPDGNGCALAIAIRKQKPSLRVLLMAFEIGAQFCKSYGLRRTGLHFLGKPFDEDTLVNRVRKLFRSRTTFPRLAPKTMSASSVLAC